MYYFLNKSHSALRDKSNLNVDKQKLGPYSFQCEQFRLVYECEYHIIRRRIRLRTPNSNSNANKYLYSHSNVYNRTKSESLTCINNPSDKSQVSYYGCGTAEDLEWKSVLKIYVSHDR